MVSETTCINLINLNLLGILFSAYGHYLNFGLYRISFYSVFSLSRFHCICITRKTSNNEYEIHCQLFHLKSYELKYSLHFSGSMILVYQFVRRVYNSPYIFSSTIQIHTKTSQNNSNLGIMTLRRPLEWKLLILYLVLPRKTLAWLLKNYQVL